jgi:hypothetical protein
MHLKLLALPALLAPPVDDASCLFNVGDMSGLKPTGTSLLCPQSSVMRGVGALCTSMHMSKLRALNWGTGGRHQAGV